MYNKTSIKGNILTIKIYREVGRAKDLSAPLYKLLCRYWNTYTTGETEIIFRLFPSATPSRPFLYRQPLSRPS